MSSVPESTAPATTDAPEPAPTSTPGLSEQQASSEFQGWSIGPSETLAMTCESGINFQTSGRFGTCCGSEPCAMPTVCSDNTVTYDNQETMDCGAEYSCVTMTIYQTPVPFDVGTPTSAIICGANWQAHTIYRNLPPEPTTTNESESSLSQLSSRDSSSSTTSSANPAESSGGSSDGSDGGSSTSIGAIAGGVVGGIAVVGILAFVIWWFRRRSAKKNAAMSVQAAGGYGSESYGGYGAAPGGGGSYPSESAAAMSQSDRHTWTQSPYQGSDLNPSPGYPMPHGHQPVPQQPPVSELGATGAWHGGQAMELDADYASGPGRQRPVSELPVDDHYGPGGAAYAR